MIPRKLQKGQQFKAATVDKVNEIIDYLKTQQIVGDGKTIKVSQLTSGVGLTVLNQSGSKQSSAAAPFDHLYKLGIENTETANYLTVQSLKSHTSGDNHYQKKLDLANITEDGRYRVKCYMTQYPQRGLFDNGWTVYLTPSAFHTGQGTEPNLRGIFTFQLGEIQRITTTITDEQTGQETEIIEYEILSQDTVGWVQYQDSMPDTAFAVYAIFVNPPADGDFIAEAFTLADFKFYVSTGEVYFDDYSETIGGINLDTPSQGVSLSQIFVNLAIDEKGGIALTMQKNQKIYDERTDDGSHIKNYTIAMIQANPYGYSDDYWVIHQYISTNLYFGSDCKVSAGYGDPQPSYLNAKLTSENNSISIDSFTNDQGYMMVNLEAEISALVSEDGSISISDTTLPDGTSAKNLESNIDIVGGKNCSASQNGNTFTIDVDDCHISISDTAPIQVTGNSQNGYVISLDKSSFVETINGDAYITVQHPANTTTRNLTLNVGAVLGHLIAGNGITITNSGNNYTIECTLNTVLSISSSISNVLELNTNVTPPVLKASGSIPNTLSIICGYQGALTYWNASGYDTYSMPVLSRDNATGFCWIQGGLSSISNTDTNPGYLINKITIADDLKNVFKFVDHTTEMKLTLSNTPSVSVLPVVSYNGGNAIWTQAAVVSVNNSDKNPSYLAEKLTSEDGSVTFTVVNGKLDLAAGGGGKVKCSQNDTADYLKSKLTSENNSISINVTGSTNQSMNLTINDSFFTCSDGSILITGSESGVDFISAGMVKINDGDTNGYLADKFTSSDQTITIETAEGKIDLKSINGGKVKCSEDDPTPSYLFDKIFSTNLSIERNLLTGAMQQVDLNIRPDYFTSSDQSITIQQSEDKINLDFRSNGMVKCSQNDVTNYLQSKLQSSKIHLLFETKSNGVAETIDMNISVNAFTSSDQSVTISEAATGQIDLTGAGKVQCTENDTADYLNTKINVDPSIAGLIALDKQDSQILIKSALTGSGVLLVENGIVKALPAPEGKAVLAVDNGSFVWMPYSDCENACQSE